MAERSVATKRVHEPRMITDWIRYAALAALVGAVLGFVGDLYHIFWGFFTDLERSDVLDSFPYRGHGVLIAIGYALAPLVVVALLLRLRAKAGVWLLVGALVTFLGTTLVAGDYWAESVVTPGVIANDPVAADTGASGAHLALVIAAFATLAIGWILVAVGAWRGGVPRGLCIPLIIAALIAFTPFAGSNLLLFVMIVVFAVWLRRPVAAAPAAMPAH